MRQARRPGYEVDKQRRLDSGASVDVHLVRDGGGVAVEIAIHSNPDRGLNNILKCPRAGYDQALALFLDLHVLRQVIQALKNLQELGLL